MSSSEKVSHQESSGGLGQMVSQRLSPSLIDLQHLSEEERNIIFSVLDRDEQLRQHDQERVKKRSRMLKNELHDLRKKGAVNAADENDNARVCIRCREPLGLLFNTGDSCPKCQHKVCKACQVTLPSGTRWLCSVCHKNMQLQLETGEWHFSQLQVDQVPLFGSDLVKASLAKAKHSLTDPTTIPVLTASDLRSDSRSSLQGKKRSDPGKGRHHKGRQDSRTSSDYTTSRQSSQRSARYDNSSSGPNSPAASLKISSRVSSSLTGNTSPSEVYSEPEDYPRGGGRNKWKKVAAVSQAGGRFFKRKGDGKSKTSLQQTRTHNRSNSSGSEPVSVTDSSEVDGVLEPISGFTFQRVSFRKDRKGSGKQDSSKDTTDQGQNHDDMGCVCSTEEPTCIPAGLAEDDQDDYIKSNGKTPVDNTSHSVDTPVIAVDVVDDSKGKSREDSEEDDIDRHFMVHGGLSPDIRNKFGIHSDSTGTSPPDTDSSHDKATSLQLSNEDSLSDEKPSPNEQNENGKAVRASITSDSHLSVDGASSPETHLPSSSNTFTKAGSIGDNRSRASASSLQRRMQTGSNLSKGSSVSMTSLYSQAGEENYGKYVITGDINFGLHYNYKTNIFEVKIKACRDLAPVDVKRIKSDPYVKTYLLPDRTKASKRKTFVRKGTVNPQYEMTLRYHISQSELETRTLSVTVWNNDAFGRNDFLGEVLVNMDSIKLDDYKPRWHQLCNKSQPAEGAVAYKGDLTVSLMYSDTVAPEVEEKDSKKKKKKDKSKKLGKNQQAAEGKGLLYVKIIEARNLVGVRMGGSSNPFIKGYLEPDRSKTGKHKTAVLRGTCNPRWDHVMKFENVSLRTLKERCLELTVWDHETLSSNEFLGGVRLNLGTGEYQRKPATWNDATGEEMKVWEQMMKAPGRWHEATIVLRPSMVSRLQYMQ
ncbi:synaptotagmin-like protein 4 isoform X6 [Patiria miniata]|uniref:Synaptotagmin-like protein 4 n=1 Tax=Patiria miniata TaxID=46514 RepID=A0A914A7N5_PATMI|nr:synaptotagmin-like protein 4 isoform X6 [Patiria miniata]